jgi:hypothetical protein
MTQQLNTVAIDLAKKVFHLVGADTTGKILVIVQGVAYKGDGGQHALYVFRNSSAFFAHDPVTGWPQPNVISRSTLPYSWYTPGALAT